MTVTHAGSTKKFSEGWEAVFGGKKSGAKHATQKKKPAPAKVKNSVSSQSAAAKLKVAKGSPAKSATKTAVGKLAIAKRGGAPTPVKKKGKKG